MVWLLSFHRASCSLWNESIKTWSQALQSARQTWKPAGNLQRKKGKKSDGGCSCKVSFSLFGVEKILSFMMIQPPLQLSISFFNSIPHFNNFWFSPWSKKNPSNQPRELGLYPSRSRIFYPHIWYSNGNILSFWYRNQVIQKPKFIYASRTKTLMKKSKWDKIFLQNRNWQ